MYRPKPTTLALIAMVTLLLFTSGAILEYLRHGRVFSLTLVLVALNAYYLLQFVVWRATGKTLFDR